MTTTPWASLAGRIAAIERTLQVNGEFTTALTAAIGDALGASAADLRCEQSEATARLTARLDALEGWIKAAGIRPRVRVAAPARRIA